MKYFLYNLNLAIVSESSEFETLTHSRICNPIVGAAVGFTFCGIFSSGLKINERVTPGVMGLIVIEMCILFFFAESFTSQRNAQQYLRCLILGTRQYGVFCVCST